MFLVCSSSGHRISAKQLISSHNKKLKNARSVIDWSGIYQSKPLYKEGRAQATIERAERAMDALGRGKPFIIVYYSSDYAGGWQSLDAPLRTITTVDRFGLVTWQGDTPYLRMLQPLELIKAMGAPTTKHLLSNGSRRDRVKLCGNGVCSPVMEVIFRCIDQLETARKSQAA